MNLPLLATLIPTVIPVLLSLLRMAAPSIPKAWLPILAPILGAVSDVAVYFATGSSLGPIWGAALGSAGVGLREIVDQIYKGHAVEPKPGTIQPPA